MLWIEALLNVGGSGVNAGLGSHVIGVHTSVAPLGMHCFMVIGLALQHFDMLHGVLPSS